MKTHIMPTSLLFCAGLLGCASCNKTEAPPAAAPVSPEEASKLHAENAAPPPPGIPPPSDVAAPPADASKTASGLVSKVVKPGTGSEHPAAEDTVEVNYTGWTTDGKMFDSSVERHRSATFPLKGVIKGWTEGLQLMTVGEKRRFWVPPELAYGTSPPAGAPAGMLVFDVELLRIIAAPKPLPAPPDVAAPPKDAKKRPSGLAYKLLQKGTGKRHPKATDQVQVHYTGWTTDGKMFDSSLRRGAPATFPLNGVIKGWTEGVQLMVEGEKARFWIPKQLAYDDRPGAPAGMLVFDIELLAIH